MIKINKYIKQQGNATSICLIAMAFFLILIAGTIFYNNSSVRASATARDHYQAQYWAEAGIKRAIDGFKTQSNNWTWIDNTALTENWQSGSNNTQERYHVSIYNKVAYDNFLKGATTQPSPLVPPNPNNKTAGDYTIVATGIVNNITHTMTADVSVSYLVYNEPMFRYGAFAGGDINFSVGDFKINTSHADANKNKRLDDSEKYAPSGFAALNDITFLSGTNIQNGVNAFEYTCKQEGIYNLGNWVEKPSDISWGLGTDFNSFVTSMSRSDRPTTTYKNMTDFAIAMSKNNGNFKDQTIYFDGYFNIDSLSTNTPLSFDNVSIFVNGSLNMTKTQPVINFNNNCLIASSSTMVIRNQLNLGNATYISFSDLTIDNSTLNAGTIYAKNNITLGNLGSSSTNNKTTLDLNTQISNNNNLGFSQNSGVSVITNNWNFNSGCS